tara:strand:+ start:1175 stop:1840 length:666 start_codon:yes stop_codon:yes gene_type:complete
MLKEFFNLLKSDSLYEQALVESYEMLDIDLSMFTESVKSLRESDSADINIDIYDMDKKINSFERDVRRKIMTHLTVNPQQDLSSGLVLVSVVIDIERIGDYTKNIYDLALNHPSKLVGGNYEESLLEVEGSTRQFFIDSVKSFKEQDIDLARRLMEDYKTEISSKCEEITKAIVSGKSSDISSSDAAAVALYARYLKRISAHCRNLISSIVNPFERIGYPE